MGKILSIQIKLITYDENDVLKAYPSLFALAWPKSDKHIPAAQLFGIIELVDTLYQALQYASWEEEIKKTLGDEIKNIFSIKEEMQKLVLSRDISAADALTYTIEESLQDLEIKAKLLKITT